ncbi:MAG: MFS transporter [Lachnospiraceae bacterium]|nr:MFS transporter [Lachnospiraceae bacterium]
MLLLYSISLSALFYSLIPLLTEYTTVDLRMNLTATGFITGLFSIISILARPLSGTLADKRNPFHIVSLASCLLAFSILGLYWSSSLKLIVFLRLCQGIFYAFSSTACFVLISREIPSSRFHEGISYYGMGQILSSSLGMNLGLAILRTISSKVSWIFLGSIMLILMVLFLLFWHRFFYGEAINKTDRLSPSALHDMSSQVSKASASILQNPSDIFHLLPFCFLGALLSATNGIESTFLVLLGQEREITPISLYFATYMIILTCSRPITGKLADRYMLHVILYPSLFLMATECLFISNALTLTPLLFAAACKALGQGTLHPMLQAECIRLLGPKRSGTASSIFLLFTDLGQGIAPIGAGYIAMHYSYAAIFNISATLYSLAILFLILFAIVTPHSH